MSTKAAYMKKIFLLLLVATSFIAKAQDASMIILGNNNNFYLNHITTPKENLYSIGRLYNISPREIAPYNNINLEKYIVSIGETIKIPLKPINFTQTNNIAEDEASIALYHIVGAKENLFQISNKYNNVLLTSLRAWNNIKDENLNAGQKIIVGYLKVKTALSALANKRSTINEPKVVIEKKLEVKASKEVKTETAKPTPEPPLEKPVVNKMPEKVKPIAKENDNVVISNSDDIEPAKDFKGGVFISAFAAEGKEENGTAGIFKSLSGWKDGKYYCLFNKAPQHTIVKITNKANGKFVYAKVLDAMPDLKQNIGLQARVSSAACNILGADENNFDCKIEY